MNKYCIENTSIKEKETFIHIDNYEKTITLYTNDKKILRKMILQIGNPTKVFPPVCKETNLNIIIISGAEWKYNYDNSDTRNKIKQIFSLYNFLYRKKDSSK